MKVFLVKPEGRRKERRPELRWLHCIENYLTSSGFNRWRKKAEGRSAWTVIMKKAVFKLYGLHVNEDKLNAIRKHGVEAF